MVYISASSPGSCTVTVAPTRTLSCRSRVLVLDDLRVAQDLLQLQDAAFQKGLIFLKP